MTSNSALSKKIWIAIVLLAFSGQLAWGVENQFFNTFMYNQITPDPRPISWMVSITACVSTATALFMGTLSDRARSRWGKRRPFIFVGYLLWGIFTYLGEIDNQGGLMKAIETGWVRREIAHSAYTRQKEIDSGQRIVVGVNKFVSGEKPSYQIHRADPAAGKEMIRRVQNLRKERDDAAVQRSLEKLREAARGKDNLMPYIIDAVESYATIEDISNALVSVFGRWQSTFLTRL